MVARVGTAPRPSVSLLVTADGEVDVRPDGALLQTPGLVAYVCAAASSAQDAEPFRFLWLGTTSSAVSPRSVSFGDRLSDGGRVATVSVATPEELSQLNRRELQVLTLLACGETNPEIAARLGVARRTVATHVERLMDKLDVSSRAAAGAIALDRGLLALPLEGGDVARLAPVGAVRVEAVVRAADNPVRRSRSRRVAPRTLVVGGVYPNNDGWREDGRQMRRGAELAIAELNRAGGVAGHLIEHVPVTVDVTSVEALNDAADQLTARDVDAVTLGYTLRRSPHLLGDFFSRASSGGAPLLHHSTSESAASIVRDSPGQFGRVFQMCGTESTYGLGFVRCLNELDHPGSWSPRNRRVLVVDEVDPDLRTFAEAAHAAAERSGWQVTVINVDLVRPDWAAVIATLSEQDPVAVMVACFQPEETARFLKLLGRRDLLVYGLYSPSVPGFLRDAGLAAEGLLWATVTGLYGDALGAAFSRAYQEHFGAPPGLSSAGIHYDMVHVLAAAWSQCEAPKDHRKVSERLRRLVHRGVNGAYQLSGPDQTNGVYPDLALDPSLAQAQLVYQVQGGSHRIISPALYATARFQPPASD